MRLGFERCYKYKAFGLRILSEIPFLELLCEDTHYKADVEVKIDYKLTAKWEKSSCEKGKFFNSGNSIMFQIQDTATFCIQEGKTILIDPINKLNLDKLRLYVLGTCFGILLMQRGILPLHGSAIAIQGKAYAIIGDSGAGKSTLASALINKGYKLLSDDVIAVDFNIESKPFVIPSYPQQKLWKESMDIFGMDTAAYRPLFERENKYAIPVISNFCSKPIPLGGIFELLKTDNTEISIREICGLERFQTISKHTFRSILISRLNRLEWHFYTSSKLINNNNYIYQIQRPETDFTTDALVSILLDEISKIEGDNIENTAIVF